MKVDKADADLRFIPRVDKVRNARTPGGDFIFSHLTKVQVVRVLFLMQKIPTDRVTRQALLMIGRQFVALVNNSEDTEEPLHYTVMLSRWDDLVQNFAFKLTIADAENHLELLSLRSVVFRQNPKRSDFMVTDE